MDALQFVLGGTLLAFGAYIIITNYVRQMANFRNRKTAGRVSSPAPVIGPLFVIVGYAALPIGFSGWIFLVVVVDPDTVITAINVPALLRALKE